MRLLRPLLLFSLLSLLTACALAELAESPLPTPASLATPGETLPPQSIASPTASQPSSPIATPTRALPEPTATPEPTIIAPVVITAGNASRIVEFGRYGYGAAYQSAWAPNGKQVAVASTLGIFLYDADLAAMTASIDVTSTVLDPLVGPITALAYSPDSQIIAAGLADGGIQWWDVDGGQRLGSIRAFNSAVQTVTFAPDGNSLAAGSLDKTNAIRRWQVSDGKSLQSFAEAAAVLRIAYSGDGQSLAAATTGKLQVWDIVSGRLDDSIGTTAELVESLAVFPKGTLSTPSASLQASLTVWNLSGGAAVVALRGPGLLRSTANSDHAALSPNGQLLAVGSLANGVRLYELSSGKLAGNFDPALGVIREMRFSPDGGFLTALVTDGLIIEWDVTSGKIVHGLLRHTQFTSVDMTPDDAELAAGGTDTAVHRWDVDSGDDLDELVAHDAPVQAISYSPEGRFLASGALDGKVLLWNLQSDQVERSIAAGGPVLSVAFTPGGSRIAAGTLDGKIGQWIVDTGAPVRQFADALTRFSHVAFSPDGRLLAADGDKMILWQADSGQPAVVKTDVTGVHSFAFAPDLKSIALASPSLLKGDDAVHLVDLATGKDTRKFSVSTALVNCLAFSADGSILAAATVDGIALWNVSTGKTLIELKGHLGGVTSIMFAVDGTLLASSSTDGTVRLWAVP